MAKKHRPMSDREKKRIARMRRDPGGRFSLEVARYLNSHGWNVLMTTGTSVHGTGKKAAFDLCIGFVGAGPDERRAVAAKSAKAKRAVTPAASEAK